MNKTIEVEKEDAKISAQAEVDDDLEDVAGGTSRKTASAFEAARASTVHPIAVAANRNQLVQLIRSNLFGQNAPAIAATEYEYSSMWEE